jgi:catechol 2,3-dioxygenase-like lactoylglutathione lyase family enzyme
MKQISSLVKGITFVTLRTADLNTARAFYLDKLGFPLLEEKAGDFFQVSIGGVPFCIDLSKEREPFQPSQIGITVADLRLLTEALTERGFSPALGEGPDGGEKWAIIKDPDGHELIFLQRGPARAYRKGPIGALMDEYERASADLKQVLRGVSERDFTAVIDPHTEDENCRSVQSIMTHVVRAGYGYADYIRDQLHIPRSSPASNPVSHQDVEERFNAMLEYTVETLDGRWEMDWEEIAAIFIDSRWGVRYNLEQLLEHAIVHIIRHRRQIERLRQQVPA